MSKRELYKKHRPHSLNGIIGQDTSVEVLQEMIKNDSIPHAILFSGPRGCGKTTLARIVARSLGCSKYDFVETNTADFRGIDEIRKIRTRIQQVPLKGKCRVWLMDECHKLTNDAQNALLKILEDTPSHIYFTLATTDPQKLIGTLRDRCTEIPVKPLSEDDVIKLIGYICREENTKIPKDVIKKIAGNCDGSPRKALVFLNKIILLKSKSKMLEAIVTATAETQAIAIARALFNPKTGWKKMATTLKETAGEEPEQIRWMVLNYAKTVLLSGGNSALMARAYLVIDTFRDHFYDSKHAGLAAACYEVVVGEK